MSEQGFSKEVWNRINSHELLRENYSFPEAKDLQNKYFNLIQNEQTKSTSSIEVKPINWIAGVDISYKIEGIEEIGVACAVLWDYVKQKVHSSTFAEQKMTFPYKAGYLGFRECRLLAQAIAELRERPDVILCDGHGIIHPRRFGEAVQLGVALDVPSIGVAKNPYIGYSDWKELKRAKSEKTEIWVDNGKSKLLGYAVSLNKGMKPVFVSIGYRIDGSMALEIVINSTLEQRIPEPIFLADKFSRNKIKSLKN